MVEQLKLTMLETMGNLTSHQVFMLGRLEVAHSNRKFAREQVKANKPRLEEAKKDSRSLGMYEDCGEYYRTRVYIVESEILSLLTTERQMEKFYKKVKHQALEAGIEERIVEQFILMLGDDNKDN